MQRLIAREFDLLSKYGVQVWDASRKRNFRCFVRVLAITSDSRGYEDMLNQSGPPWFPHPCPRCWDEGVKTTMGKRIFCHYYRMLAPGHPWRTEEPIVNVPVCEPPLVRRPDDPPPPYRSPEDFKLNRLFPSDPVPPPPLDPNSPPPPSGTKGGCSSTSQVLRRPCFSDKHASLACADGYNLFCLLLL